MGLTIAAPINSEGPYLFARVQVKAMTATLDPYDDLSEECQPHTCMIAGSGTGCRSFIFLEYDPSLGIRIIIYEVKYLLSTHLEAVHNACRWVLSGLDEGSSNFPSNFRGPQPR
jgi:hypothetical protein